MTFRTRAALGALVLVYILCALAFVGRPGIEADEALVANPAMFSLGPIPLMDMSYLGALKQWFYMAWFSVAKPGPVTLRVPTVIVGAVALWLFFLLIDRTIGRRAAWVATALLATDAMFVLLEAIDFGPNALHFVFKLAGMLLLVRFHRDPRARFLAAGFLLFGLGLWDKTIFAWCLFGIGVATLAVFPREIWTHFNARNLGIATAALILGAMPLVLYNIVHPLDTFRSNIRLNSEPLAHKVDLLRYTLGGEALFSFFTAVDPPPRSGEASTAIQKISQRISETAHHPLTHFAIPALCLACLGLFARASRKPVLFGLLACVGTWIPMALTNGAGGAAHHVILLFPFQYLSIAAALAAIPWRFASGAVTLVLCAASLAVTNEYYWELTRNGPAIRWTDALYPLDRELERLRSPDIYIADWGIYESLVLLGDGALPLAAIDAANPLAMKKAIGDPRNTFVAHTPHFAYTPQQRTAIEDAAANEGYEEVPLETIYDRNGRPTFELFRFRKLPL
jgi:hypothetical protein